MFTDKIPTQLRNRKIPAMGQLRRVAGVAAAALLAGISAAALGDSVPFTGFTPGNLVVSRTVYQGNSSTLTVGQALPPLCPSTAACGAVKATDSGAYPSETSSNNVFNNDKADGSFGITSPIYLDQITPSGTLISTLPVPAGLLSTSFSSKSELALNLSPDHTALTFMGYIAPVNMIDASNSNTPAVYDPTNPAGSSVYRAVAQVGSNGAIEVTPTNAYSGNNGRAAVLAGGLYYMVGNANNGGGTPANVVGSAGVQVATPGQSAATPPTEVGSFSITQVTNPDTGSPYPADKPGKDNNFRGLTVFNNTLYVTKGSGGNGINTVYQVGNAGSLPTLANAASTPITVLPGFPTTLAKNAGASNPFGIWFANGNTLYVADEGDGVVADAAASTNAGLQKWILSANGTWTRAYTLTNGLNLGQPYTVSGYPTALNPATDGLRNITGKLNSDGTVTIYAVTSTVSANGDQGADPNKLVAITDVLTNTNAAAAATEQFTTLRSAAAGEVLRGVSLAPTAATTPMANVPLVESAATSGSTAIAPGSLATIFGQNLTTGTPSAAPVPYPTSFDNTAVTIVDSAGNSFSAPLLYASSGQVNFQVPSGAAAGNAKVTVASGANSQSAANVQIAPVAPGIFTLNNSGLAAADIIRVSANGTQTPEQVFTADSNGNILSAPIAGLGTDQLYLVLFGTGLSSVSASTVQVRVNGVTVPVLYAGPQGGFAGLDQINVQLPASLAGKGTVLVQVTAAGIAANPVQIVLQ